MMDQKHRDSLLRLRAAIDALLEKGYGDGRGHEADEASTEVATMFGALSIERARAVRLRDVLQRLADENPLLPPYALRELENDRRGWK